MPSLSIRSTLSLQIFLEPHRDRSRPLHWRTWGREGTRGYISDYQMMVFNNAQERTVGEFAKLGQESGWKMTALNVGGHGAFACVIYIPV